jgi:hypothetical protein
MPLSSGETFVGFTIVLLLESGGMRGPGWLSIPDFPNQLRSRSREPAA